jgi:hypothetical protein
MVVDVVEVATAQWQFSTIIEIEEVLWTCAITNECLLGFS